MISNEKLAKMSDEEFYEAAKEEFKDLPRAQRRQKERELKEHVKTMNQLNPKQLSLMEEVIKYGVKAQAHEEVDKIIGCLDRCINAYLYIKYADYIEKDVLKEQDIISGLLDEDSTKISNILKECKGDTIMAKKKIEKYQEEVKNVVADLLNNQVKQSQAIVILQDKFPMLSKAMLINEFKKIKAAREEVQEDPEIIAAAEYIFPELKEEENTANEIKNEEEVEVKKESKLKIKSKEVVVEGEFGEYKIDRAGVEIGELKFGNIYDVEQYAAEELDLFNRRISELKEVMVGEF